MVGRVVDDAKAVARAEVDVVRARASAKLRNYRSAALAFGAALLFASGALLALAAGIIAILVPVVGPIWATVTAVAGFLALAVVCAMIGRRWL